MEKKPKEKTKRPGRRVSIRFTQPTLTKQSFADQCNINKIMAKYHKTGVIDHLNNREAQYGDFSALQDYQESMNLVIKADELFELIPAKIRKEFDNDPAQFLEFAQNPENLDKMIEWGLAPEKKPEPGSARKDSGMPVADKKPAKQSKQADKEPPEIPLEGDFDDSD